MSPEWLKAGIELAALFISCTAGFYVWFTDRQRVHHEKFSSTVKELDDRLKEKNLRLTRVEEALRHVPTHADMQKLEIRVSDVHADLQKVVGGVEGLRRAVDLMSQHLLEGGR